MINPGTKIVCPDCDLFIATVLETIDLEEGVFADQFEWNIDEPEEDFQSECPRCWANWGDTGGYLHTDRGWQS